MTTATVPPKPKQGAFRLVQAGPEHLGALSHLWQAFELEDKGYAAPEAEAEAFAMDCFTAVGHPDRLILVAIVGKKAVGFLAAAAAAQQWGFLKAVVHCSHLYVRPKYRTLPGLGHALAAAVRDWAKAKAAITTFEVKPDKAIVERWRRRGFAPLTVTMVEGR